MRVALLAASLACVAIAWAACAEFQPSEPESDAGTSDGALDGVANDGSATDGSATDGGATDGAVGEFDLEVRPVCPPPAAGTPCTGIAVGTKPCEPKKIFTPPAPEYAFDL